VAREIVPLAVRLRIIDARERVIRDRIDQATDPNTIRRLQRRLDHLHAREGGLRDRLNALRA
jgi:predicted  nucleic acid-binding Zn-ribbon protein